MSVRIGLLGVLLSLSLTGCGALAIVTGETPFASEKPISAGKKEVTFPHHDYVVIVPDQSTIRTSYSGKVEVWLRGKVLVLQEAEVPASGLEDLAKSLETDRQLFDPLEAEEFEGGFEIVYKSWNNASDMNRAGMLSSYEARLNLSDGKQHRCEVWNVDSEILAMAREACRSLRVVPRQP